MAAMENSDQTGLPDRSLKLLQGMSLVTVIFVFALVLLGGIVRVTGSGLGCPDWPLCHGKLLPPLELTAIIEYTHRIVASGLVAPLILATCAVVWFTRRHERWLVIPVSVAVVMLVLQGLLGAVTVLTELPGAIVAAHLALGEALLACLVLVAVVAFKGPLNVKFNTAVGPDSFQKLMLISGLGVYLLVMSGSWVTAIGATAACITWPFCDGSPLPNSQLTMIHMGHRYVALIIGVLLLYTLHLGIQNKQRPREIRLFSMIVAALFMAQVVVGAVTIWSGFAIGLTALHLAMATAVWGTTAALAMLSLSRGALYAPQAAAPIKSPKSPAEGTGV